MKRWAQAWNAACMQNCSFGETAGAGVLSSVLAFMATYHDSFAAGQAFSHWQACCFSSTRILCNSDHWRVTEPVLLSLLRWWVRCLLQQQNRAARASAMVDAWASVFLHQGVPRFSNGAWCREAVRRNLPPQYLAVLVVLFLAQGPPYGMTSTTGGMALHPRASGEFPNSDCNCTQAAVNQASKGPRPETATAGRLRPRARGACTAQNLM